MSHLKTSAPERPVGRIPRSPAAPKTCSAGRAPLSKIVEFEDANELCSRLRRAGKTIVQCHGTFDLIHPGHIVHFQEARALGDVLVITLTGEKFVR